MKYLFDFFFDKLTDFSYPFDQLNEKSINFLNFLSLKIKFTQQKRIYCCEELAPKILGYLVG